MGLSTTVARQGLKSIVSPLLPGCQPSGMKGLTAEMLHHIGHWICILHSWMLTALALISWVCFFF